MINEGFLQFIWYHRLWDQSFSKMINGNELEVLDVGVPNFDAGPDFFNAKIKTGNTVWVGNVEIHVNSSEWFHHNHHLDKAYDNVILHVVFNHDKEVVCSNGIALPVFEMRIPDFVLSNYRQLLSKTDWPACSNEILKFDKNKIKFWLERVAVERLESKTEAVSQIFRQHNGSWEAVWLFQLGAAMGFKVNKEPFILLMQRTPFKVILKESGNLFRLEALLFGQAGFLDEIMEDDYAQKLKLEYAFLKQKYSLTGMPGYLWKFARMRPGNFPTIRLAQFAAIIYKHPAMVAELLEQKTKNQLFQFFNSETSEYWNNHFKFGIESKTFPKLLGKSAIELIIINVVVPFVFFYGKYHDFSDKQELAIDWLLQTEAENNFIIRHWNETGIIAENAMQSQALIHQREFYCLRRRCVSCYIGNEILKTIK